MHGIAFSVIMPVYNAADTLCESIESVLNQTFDNFELIVIDDCSTDGCRALINKYAGQDFRIRPIFSEVNNGVSISRNLGIESTKGRYIAFLDSDDLWLPDKLEAQYRIFNDGACVVYSSYIRFFPNGTERIVKVPPQSTYKSLLRGNCIGNLTGAYDSYALGKFYQKPIGHEDFLMWLQILSSGAVAKGLERPLARYRVGINSLSGNKLRAAIWTWNIFRVELGLSFWKSSVNFSWYAVASLLKRT